MARDHKYAARPAVRRDYFNPVRHRFLEVFMASFYGCSIGIIRACPLAIIAALFAAALPVEAEDVAKPATTQGMSATDILDALISSREKLHAGTCRARWKWQTKSYKETANWTLYFDYDKAWSRIDRQVVNRAREVIRIDTPLEVIHYVPGPALAITRRLPGAPALADGYVFDTRVAGLAQLISIKGNAATWDNFLTMVKRDGPPLAQREASGMVKLTFEGTEEIDTRDGKYFVRSGYAFWVDPALQFSPVRAEFFNGSARDAASIEPKVSAVIKTEWTERDGAPVPRHCSWTLPIHDQTAELTFEWISVNRSVPPVLFTPEGLNAPKGTHIINAKLGEPIIESIIGEEPPQQQSARPTSNTQILVAIGRVRLLAFDIDPKIHRLLANRSDATPIDDSLVK